MGPGPRDHHAAKRLPAAARAVLDAQVAASAADAFDPDDLVWAVQAAADDLRAPRTVERAEQRRRESSFVSVQAGFDGGLRPYGEFDAVTGAPILNALDAAAGPPTPTGSTADVATAAAANVGAAVADADAADDAASGEGDGDGQQAPGSWSAGPRSRQYATALAQITADWLTAIPTKTRIAVQARDRGCRFPGSADPTGHSDVHHLVHREHGGDHHPDNLALLSRRHHTLVHHHGWTLALDPPTGQITATRRARTWRSLPRGTPLAPPPRRDPDRPA